MLSPEEQERYKRNILLPELGIEGQLRLKQATVLVVGAGGLGSSALLYLASAGVGNITIVDHDVVDRSNLQRQIIHTIHDIGRHKALSAQEKIAAINPDAIVRTHTIRFNELNAEELISECDFIIDATDSFEAKLTINDYCKSLGKTYSYGSVSQYEGLTTTITPDGACLRCLFDTAPSGEGSAGPLGVVPGIIGTIQAAEAIKSITGIGQILRNQLLAFDCRTMQFNSFRFKINANCKCQSLKI